MNHHTMAGIVVLCAGLFSNVVCAAEQRSATDVIPAEDYALYDQTIESIFLTSYTRLVVIERMTVVRLLPDQQELITIGSFHDRNFFMGRLPADLVRDFVGANREAGRLEGRFQFGVRYRFVTGRLIEEPEVSAAVPVQAVPVLERLAFSRVGRTLRKDQALVYVEQRRPDETGAGFLVWFHQKGREWTIVDTEVVWTIQGGQRQ
ncbi:MAG: hypothetical protein HP477_09960 [Nitrospira sp.]|nr:hypothetical protein [Nitrospira sp.]